MEDFIVIDEMKENVKKHFINKKKRVENAEHKQKQGRLLQR